MFPRVSAAVAAIVCATSMTLVSPVMADPPEVDALIVELEDVSRDAEALTEEVKELEDSITAKQIELERLRADVVTANDEAEKARVEVQAAHEKVNQIAAAKYRASTVDPLTSMIDAESPQQAIDRSAYLSALSKKSTRAVEQLQDAMDTAAKAKSRANRAEAQAEFQAGQLEARRLELDSQQVKLDDRIAKLKDRIDRLSIQDRMAWMNRHDPVDYDILGITSANGIGLAALQAAYTKIGAPYSWGATGPSAFDCSGLVWWAYQQQGVTLPRTSQAQMAGGMPVSRDNLQPGDIIGYYGGLTHVGIYAGNGMVLHASDYGIPVQVVPMDSMPYAGAVRY